jgi:hypothetical protein
MSQKHAHRVSHGTLLVKQQNMEDVVLEHLAPAWRQVARMDIKSTRVRASRRHPHSGKLHLSKYK